MGKYAQTLELSTNLSYALYHVLANRFNVCSTPIYKNHSSYKLTLYPFVLIVVIIIAMVIVEVFKGY